ncbi:hypothetical protein RQP46_003488 [Phenoliferia psychrophenolica]
MASPMERTKGPDGETIVDFAFYDLLGVKGDATDAEIKKAYRKQALLFHPDRNPGDETAAAKFQEIGEAYGVLSDQNLRAVYNKQGKKSAVEGAGGEMPDPGQMFSQLFGGAAFLDWIGEISLGKDVGRAFEMTTTEEEREALKTDMQKAGGDTPPATTPSVPQSTLSHTAFEEVPSKPAPTPTTSTPSPAIPEARPEAHVLGTDGTPGSLPAKGLPTTSASLSPATSLPPTPTATPAGQLSPAERKAAAEKKAAERAAEREKMEAYEKERQEEKRERVRTLVQKLLDRIRPCVEATNPADGNDPEVKKYLDRMREESHDLAMESFGVEICWLIGEVYMTKASQYIKLHKKASSNILGIPAWSSRVKEKFTMLKEGWSFLSVGLDIQSSMADMERRQAKGELDEDEMKNLETDLSGKGSKFELSAILRQVVDIALSKESPAVTDAILMNRAKAILLTGAILKAVQPDESDVERRELERMVAEANQKRKDKGKAPKKK